MSVERNKNEYNLNCIFELGFIIKMDASELALVPEIYCPSVDTTGNYTDQFPPSNKSGIVCSCGTRGTVFKTRSQFNAHIKSKSHVAWLETLNNNRVNYYAECVSLKSLVESQMKIIKDLENRLAVKETAINEYQILLHNARKNNGNNSGKMNKVD